MKKSAKKPILTALENTAGWARNTAVAGWTHLANLAHGAREAVGTSGAPGTLQIRKHLLVERLHLIDQILRTRLHALRRRKGSSTVPTIGQQLRGGIGSNIAVLTVRK